MIYQSYLQYTSGWTRVDSVLNDSKQQWLHQHPGGMFGFRAPTTLLFQHPEDATLYILKWS